MDQRDDRAMFAATADAYDAFMGRYSQPLAVAFADAAGVAPGQTALDVGCGPGALTGELVARLGAPAVAACDPSASFVAECAARNPGVEVRVAPAEALPFEDARFDIALAQLVLHFVGDPATAAGELRRVVRPGGTIAACVWDFHEEMEMLRLFWDAALAVVPDAPDEARTLRFGLAGDLAGLFDASGLSDVTETALRVQSSYEDFEELWAGFQAGIGPAGAFCTSLPDEPREALRRELFDRLGAPASTFTLDAVARCATGRVPT